MENITIKGRIEFCNEATKEFNGDFVATLCESGAFHYGNGTMVVVEFGIMANGNKPQRRLIDTRYERIDLTKQGFEQFLRQWFKDEYLEHTLIIKAN